MVYISHDIKSIILEVFRLERYYRVIHSFNEHKNIYKFQFGDTYTAFFDALEIRGVY